ncbi:Spy/CpxP family protein refolding chaperone [Undibacterium curvum]|uniref:Spy/CpxP family protein refolding chaperone n=1 Tax=Undibacterium curvum TaxID=2762294 RepID=A0ABR7A6G6_9BURK|nr:Spy/CpxP family protein refolding chaperone [Undibacterium curvum]MBC3932504.1 Spy/CpxP family protein refolding chaperone [Undibacterium curvum]
MKSIQTVIQSVLLTSGIVLSAAASAQSVPPQPPPPPPHGAHGQEGAPGHHAMDMAKWQEKMKERMAKRQAELRDLLKLTPAQEPAWKTFVQSMEPKGMTLPQDPKEMDKLSTPERMERSLERMKEHQASLQNRLAALKNFYGSLTPEQQKLFDENHRRIKKDMQDRMAKEMQRKDGPPPMSRP